MSMRAAAQTRMLQARVSAPRLTARVGGTTAATRRSYGATASDFSRGAGLSLASRSPTAGRPSGRGGALSVQANAKRCLGSTTGGTNRHRKRTSGFRVRKRTATGSKVLKNRRKKGRKQLAPASKHSGKK